MHCYTWCSVYKSATRVLLCRRAVPKVSPSDDQVKPQGDRQAQNLPQTAGGEGPSSNGNGNGHHVHDSQRVNGDLSAQGTQQDSAQTQEASPGFVPPYRGIPGYYSYGAPPGLQYDPAVQDQYLYQYNYNGLHPYWRNAYMRDEDASWDEQNPDE